ncbi:hypothetical protein [Georgenia sp. MJ170]|uniref:hypothetical protein n=1 Tax=Georgenia sunbinii TaxID=3117728 RepID=UPI002F260F3D
MTTDQRFTITDNLSLPVAIIEGRAYDRNLLDHMARFPVKSPGERDATIAAALAALDQRHAEREMEDAVANLYHALEQATRAIGKVNDAVHDGAHPGRLSAEQIKASRDELNELLANLGDDA